MGQWRLGRPVVAEDLLFSFAADSMMMLIMPGAPWNSAEAIVPCEVMQICVIGPSMPIRSSLDL